MSAKQNARNEHFPKQNRNPMIRVYPTYRAVQLQAPYYSGISLQLLLL